MTGKVVRRQDNEGVLTQGHFTGNAIAQGIFCIGSIRAGADQREEQSKNQQECFPHRITVFLY
jgi:hypothetical protein